MFTFSEMLALVESESSFGAYVCHGRPGGSIATSDLVEARKNQDKQNRDSDLHIRLERDKCHLEGCKETGDKV